MKTSICLVKYFVILIFILESTVSFGQRNFFVDNKVLFNCDSTTIIFDEQDSLPFYIKLYWEIKPDSIEINRKYYYPFIFGYNEDEPNRRIGYIRYYKKKVFILPADEPEKHSEQVLFNFSLKKSPEIYSIDGLSGYTIHNVRRFYSFRYGEMIYVFKMDYDNYSGLDFFDEIQLGIKSGLIKAHFISHYGSCCDMECIRRYN